MFWQNRKLGYWFLLRWITSEKLGELVFNHLLTVKVESIFSISFYRFIENIGCGKQFALVGFNN
ncbi:MAG TPA: hypothetical protein DEO84_07685 [candidate division Zixibacteria bacterium]|nr:hypothetical protein [candidate division Zixibacteria bacterium]HBZ01184.1 hypothetical protein [candidate division Zixibacteria bacterium]